MSVETIENSYDVEFSDDQIALQQELKRSSRHLQKLQEEKKQLHMSLPEHFVREAEIENEIDQLKRRRTEMGKALLNHEKKAEQAKEKRSLEAAKKRDKLIDGHLNKVAAFVKKARGLEKLSKDFEALVAEAKEIEVLNRKAGYTFPVGGITPKNHTTMLRNHLVSLFGFSVMANIHPVRDSSMRSFDIAAHADSIVKAIVDALESDSEKK